MTLNMQRILHTRHYNIHGNIQENILVLTRSKQRLVAKILLKVHGIDKGVDPNLRPINRQ